MAPPRRPRRGRTRWRSPHGHRNRDSDWAGVMTPAERVSTVRQRRRHQRGHRASTATRRSAPNASGKPEPAWRARSRRPMTTGSAEAGQAEDYSEGEWGRPAGMRRPDKGREVPCRGWRWQRPDDSPVGQDQHAGRMDDGRQIALQSAVGAVHTHAHTQPTIGGRLVRIKTRRHPLRSGRRADLDPGLTVGSADPGVQGRRHRTEDQREDRDPEDPESLPLPVRRHLRPRPPCNPASPQRRRRRRRRQSERPQRTGLGQADAP